MSIQFSEKMKAQAQTKLWVKWKYTINGYSDMIYYSFETSKSLRDKDQSYGLKKLIKLAEHELVGKYEIAIIYDNISGQELRRYREGRVVNNVS